MTKVKSFLRNSFTGLGLFLLASNLCVHAEPAKAISKQLPVPVCKDNVRFAIWFSGGHFDWHQTYRAQILTDGRFEVSDNYDFSFEKIPQSDILIKGRLEEKDIVPLLEKVEKANFFSLQDHYGADLQGRDGPAAWHILYCKDGKTKSILSGYPKSKEPNPAEVLIKEAQGFFQKQLEARKIKMDVNLNYNN